MSTANTTTLKNIKRKKRKESHLATDYVNNATFQKALYDWYEALKEKPDLQIPPTITLCVWQICSRLATKANFAGYSYIDEMESAGLERCIKALKEQRYDPYKYTNPFAYFTTVAFYEFLRVLKEEQKESYIKQASLSNHYHAQHLDPNVDTDSQDMGLPDVNWDLIEKFQPKPRAARKGKKLVDNGPEVVEGANFEVSGIYKDG